MFELTYLLTYLHITTITCKNCRHCCGLLCKRLGRDEDGWTWQDQVNLVKWSRVCIFYTTVHVFHRRHLRGVWGLWTPNSCEVKNLHNTKSLNVVVFNVPIYLYIIYSTVMLTYRRTQALIWDDINVFLLLLMFEKCHILIMLTKWIWIC